MRYLLGIAAALCAGTAFNVGILIQKSAVDRLPHGRLLLRTLLKRPVWLSGFVLQFIFGTPLYIVAIGLIGPAVVPGIMAFGLVVLATGAVAVRKERIRPKEVVGISLVILAVVGFASSHLSIDVLSFSMTDPVLLRRSAFFAGAVIVVATICAVAARRVARGRAFRHEPAAVFHAVRAGLWYNVSNLCLGFITAGIALVADGRIGVQDSVVLAGAVVLALAANFFGVAATQNALANGRAAVAIPLQDGVSQIVPVGIFFIVYRPYIPDAASFVSLGAAAALLITGVVFLTDRLAASEVETPKAAQ